MFNKDSFLREMENILEMGENTLNLNDEINLSGNWDSLAILAFIAMIDEKYSITISSDDISACLIVNDLKSLVEEKINNNSL